MKRNTVETSWPPELLSTLGHCFPWAAQSSQGLRVGERMAYSWGQVSQWRQQAPWGWQAEWDGRRGILQLRRVQRKGRVGEAHGMWGQRQCHGWSSGCRGTRDHLKRNSSGLQRTSHQPPGLWTHGQGWGPQPWTWTVPFLTLIHRPALHFLHCPRVPIFCYWFILITKVLGES